MTQVELPHKPRRDEVFRVAIDALDEKGEGLAWLDVVVGPQRAPMRLEVHVRRTVPGDLVDVCVANAKRRRVDGYAAQIVTPSARRISARCSHFPSDGARPGCGGCSLQHLSLSDQRAAKRERVQSLFARRRLDPEIVEPVIGVGDGWRYRNKMEFSFADEDGELFCGMHPGGFKYEVIDQQECWLASERVAAIVRETVAWARTFGVPAYRAEVGFWRGLVVREGLRTGERMVELVTSHLEPPPDLAESWARFVAGTLPDVTSTYWTQVRAVRGERTRQVEQHLGGRATLGECLEVRGAALRFEIAPSAFFQPNTFGAELLYSLVAEHAAPTGAEEVLDLYCGAGTIALCLAPHAGHVLGVELVEAAVQNAVASARLNDIHNVSFVAGDVGAVLAERRPHADVVVVDPPRAGLLPAAHEALEALDARRLVYVSCNPEALARDLELLSARWTIERVRPVDMFPQTAHIETVVSLTR